MNFEIRNEELRIPNRGMFFENGFLKKSFLSGTVQYRKMVTFREAKANTDTFNR